jgi:hypothetical protein
MQLIGGAPKAVKVKKTVEKSKGHGEVAALRLQIKLESYKAAIKKSKDNVAEASRTNEELKKVEEILTAFAHNVDTNAVEAVRALFMKLDTETISAFCTELQSCTSSNFEDKIRRLGHVLYGNEMKNIIELSKSLDAAKSTGDNLMVYAFLKGGITPKALTGIISHVFTFKAGQSASSSSSASANADALAESLAKMSM